MSIRVYIFWFFLFKMFGLREESAISLQSWTKLTAVSILTEEKAMYSAELEKHKREKEEWRNKAENLGDHAAALQVSSNLCLFCTLLDTSIYIIAQCLCVILDKLGWSERSSRICLPPHWPTGPQRGTDRRSEETRWDHLSISPMTILKSVHENLSLLFTSLCN